MKWFAAHIVMVVKLTNPKQGRFPIWENIVLVSAESEPEAFAKAEEYGRLEEGDDDGTFRWGGHPARWVFAGVRKLTECAAIGDHPDDGTEITFNELEVDSQEALERFVAGRSALVKCNDRFRAPKNARQKERPRGVARKSG
jgi:hypothetical protein